MGAQSSVDKSGGDDTAVCGVVFTGSSCRYWLSFSFLELCLTALSGLHACQKEEKRKPASQVQGGTPTRATCRANSCWLSSRSHH